MIECILEEDTRDEEVVMMKQSLVLIFIGALSFLSLHAMIQPPTPASLLVKNRIPGGIVLEYQYVGMQKPEAKNLGVGESFRLENLERLYTLYIVPGLITRLFRKKEDLSVQAKRVSEGTRNVNLTIEPVGGLSREYFYKFEPEELPKLPELRVPFSEIEVVPQYSPRKQEPRLKSS